MKLGMRSIRRAVIIAPHPDDEIIGASALIAALRRRGSDVRVIIVSDGAASHPTSASWPRERLIAARRRESRSALARLGIDARAVTFLGLPDGGLPACLPRCRRALRRALDRYAGIDLIVGPAAADAHPDHRAVAAALAAYPTKALRLTYQVWPPHGRAKGCAASVVMSGGVVAKRSLIGVHRTQLGAIRDDSHGFTIAPHELAVFAHPIERFAVLAR